MTGGTAATGSLDRVRGIADAVLYEGYLLYPYRASSSKNQSRWQFGVLGPPRAEPASFAEDPRLEMQCLLEATGADSPSVESRLRFLQHQTRTVERRVDGGHVPVGELVVDGVTLLSWQEAHECEVVLPAYDPGPALAGADAAPVRTRVEVPGGEEVEVVRDAGGARVGRIVRRRSPLVAQVEIRAEPDDGYARLSVAVANDHPETAAGKEDALRLALISAHMLVSAAGGAGFVSLLEPPAAAAAAAARCRQHRCFPVLAGLPGSTDVVLGSPIILYDHPEIAEESAGALFDSTEIDEILTLRVMTMTDEEKAEARATDPRAAEIVDRCDAMSDDALQQLHGALRSPEPRLFDTGEVPWWDPAADESVRPEVDSVVVDGVRVAKGSLVRVHPSRRADAQDLFFADRVARVTAVLSDVDGGTHVALVLADDPAADLHEWYGRYLYFAPDEIEPLDQAREAREESHP
ncbi:hypothetical protein IE331_07395 [Nocardioides sp. MJB4]|uniref:Uncharacterized protein n=2 Tax=Nocardioides donggukensis TaxID=2774019 RepID=A0A927Q1H1_9ACTN|nr:hypothetical protein [Nocardioides donggukensis]